MNHKKLYIAIKNLYDSEEFYSQHDIAVALNDLKVKTVGAKQWTASGVSIFMCNHGKPRRKEIYGRYVGKIGCRQCIIDNIEYDIKDIAPWISLAIHRGLLIPGKIYKGK